MDVADLVVSNAEWIALKARRYCEDPTDADDLASETIYKCLSQARRFDTARAFRPWALTIMANTYITEYNRRRCVLFTALEGCDPCGSVESDQLARWRSVVSVVRQTARRSCNIECVLLYAEGYSYEEISMMIGVGIGTVKSRIANGRRMLREALS